MMRILTSSKVYRAFPELDRFEDERCARFVKAAKSSIWWNWGSKLGLLALLLVVGMGTFAAFVVVSARLDTNPRPIQSDALQVLSMAGLLLVALAIPFFIMLVARDLNLRKRLHYVLRARGTCMSCHYSLVGLAVDERCAVICPECGETTRVDESLGELVLDDAGRARFKPSEDALPIARHWPSPSARRAIKKWTKRTAIAIPVALAVLWGCYELLLQWQASAAKSQRPGPGGLLAFVEQAQPADAPPGTPDAWETFDTITARVREIRTRLEALGIKTRSGSPVVVDASWLIAAPPRLDDDETRERRALEQDLARQFLAAVRDDGIFDLMDEMAKRRRAVRTIAFSPSQPAISASFPELAFARELARISAARFEVAKKAGDANEMLRALQVNLALARMCSLQGTILHELVGVAVDALALDRARQALMESPSPEIVDAIARALDTQAPRESTVQSIRGEHLYTLDTIGWVFSDPSNVRLGRLSPRLKAFGIQPSLHVPLGFYWQNRDELAAFFATIEKAAAVEPFARPPSAFAFATPNFALLQAFTPAVVHACEVGDQSNLMRRGVRTMAALEKFRLEQGTYPPSLQALVPKYLPALPIDPWSGTSLGYRLVDPVTDPHKRGYLLYSVGGDRQDNVGEPCDDNCFLAERAAGDTDFVVNRPDR